MPQRTDQGAGQTAAHASGPQGAGHLRIAERAGKRRRLRILSFNTWHGNRAPERIITLLKKERPDVAIFVEFGPNKRWLLDALARAYPYQAGCSERWFCSVVILSRLPIRAGGSDGRDLGPSPPMAWIELMTAAGPLRIYGVHIMRPIDGPRGHVRELAYLARLIQAHRRRGNGGLAFVAGDFNATRWAQSLRRFERDAGLTHMGRFLPSWPAGPRGWPQLAIDHAFASPGLRFTQARLGALAGSDHLPLVLDLALAAPLVSARQEPRNAHEAIRRGSAALSRP